MPSLSSSWSAGDASGSCRKRREREYQPNKERREARKQWWEVQLEKLWPLVCPWKLAPPTAGLPTLMIADLASNLKDNLLFRKDAENSAFTPTCCPARRHLVHMFMYMILLSAWSDITVQCIRALLWTNVHKSTVERLQTSYTFSQFFITSNKLSGIGGAKESFKLVQQIKFRAIQGDQLRERERERERERGRERELDVYTRFLILKHTLAFHQFSYQRLTPS